MTGLEPVTKGNVDLFLLSYRIPDPDVKLL